MALSTLPVTVTRPPPAARLAGEAPTEVTAASCSLGVLAEALGGPLGVLAEALGGPPTARATPRYSHQWQHQRSPPADPSQSQYPATPQLRKPINQVHVCLSGLPQFLRRQGRVSITPLGVRCHRRPRLLSGGPSPACSAFILGAATKKYLNAKCKLPKRRAAAGSRRLRACLFDTCRRIDSAGAPGGQIARKTAVSQPVRDGSGCGRG